MSSWVRICISTLPPFFGQTFWSTFLIWNTSNSEKRSAKQKTRLVEVSDERWVVFKTLKKKSCKNWPSKWTLCISSVQFSSVTQSCPTLCNPVNLSTPGLPVHHQLPEFTQTHVHWVTDAIQPSHLLLPPIPPSIRVFSNESNLCMRWPKYGVSALASVLPKKSQGWTPSEWTGWISLQSKGLSWVFSNTTVQKHQFFSAWLSSQSNSHIHTWLLGKP